MVKIEKKETWRTNRKLNKSKVQERRKQIFRPVFEENKESG